MERIFEKEKCFTEEKVFLENAKKFSEATKWTLAPIYASRVRCLPTEEKKENLFLKAEGKKYFLNPMGKASLPARAGVGGSVLADLSNEDWCKVLNLCLPRRKGLMLLNELEGEVYSAHSDNYIVLSVDEIFSKTAKGLKSLFPTAKFIGGSLSPEFASAEYSLANEEAVVRTYEEAFKEVFAKSVNLVAPLIRVCTSNTSESGANIYPCLKRRGEDGLLYSLMAGEPIKLLHKGNSSIARFEENVAGTMSLINKSAENIVRLTYIMINYPQKCFLNLCQRLGLPKPACMEIGTEIADLLGDRKTHAKFLYLAMCRIQEKVNCKTEKERWDLINQIARVFTIDFTKYDTKYCEWLKNNGDPVQIAFF